MSTKYSKHLLYLLNIFNSIPIAKISIMHFFKGIRINTYKHQYKIQDNAYIPVTVTNGIVKWNQIDDYKTNNI